MHPDPAEIEALFGKANKFLSKDSF